MSGLDRRDAIDAELVAIGDRRRAALQAADLELAALIGLVPAALDAGVTLKDIAAHGATTRTTLYSRTGLRSPSRGGRPQKILSR
jgi:hypothetical protein